MLIKMDSIINRFKENKEGKSKIAEKIKNEVIIELVKSFSMLYCFKVIKIIDPKTGIANRIFL